MRTRLPLFLYLICVLTDFIAFVVVFTVSRSLAEEHVEPWYLGLAGAGLSFSAGVGSLLGGWLAYRFDGRVVFVCGAVATVLSIVACGLVDLRTLWFQPCYWSLGIGPGFLYPPLIGWLNQGEDAHANRRGVSRRLILFCVAWNAGMMCGQLAGGSLYAGGARWAYGAALSIALVNLLLALTAVRRVVPLAAVPIGRTRQEHETMERAAAFKRLSWIANLGGWFGGSLVIHLLPGLVVTIGIAADDHGKLLACWRAVIIATYLVMHRAAFWHYRLHTSLVVQGVGACGLVVIAQAESAVTLLIGLALLGQLAGYNYFSGLFYSTAGSSHERRALAAGIHEATVAAGMALGTIAGGVLGSLVSHRMPYLLAAVVILLLMVVQSVAWWSWVRPLSQGRLRADGEPVLSLIF
ncbi:MAG: MFS transporter [Planctomycetes bacterium]|nr:MFS transporter [Planctomycetota bacterium]